MKELDLNLRDINSIPKWVPSEIDGVITIFYNLYAKHSTSNYYKRFLKSKDMEDVWTSLRKQSKNIRPHLKQLNENHLIEFLYKNFASNILITFLEWPYFRKITVKEQLKDIGSLDYLSKSLAISLAKIKAKYSHGFSPIEDLINIDPSISDFPHKINSFIDAIRKLNSIPNKIPSPTKFSLKKPNHQEALAQYFTFSLNQAMLNWFGKPNHEIVALTTNAIFNTKKTIQSVSRDLKSLSVNPNILRITNSTTYQTVSS